MSKNIKEIGKELMGKSLNSFHRKTGLTQLEKNNEIQDGILDGILSQVDDAYIEKTEQSNVIHLEGSGDGVVVLDSIEGNTMVNIVSSKIRSLKTTNTFGWIQDRFHTPNGMIKPNTKYTVVCEVLKNTSTTNFGAGGGNNTHNQLKNDGYKSFRPKETGVKVSVLTSYDTFNNSATIIMPQFGNGGASQGTYEIGEMIEYRLMILEGDYGDKELNFFDGLLSSFEEKRNDEGKYEIEILSNNRNIYIPTQQHSETYGIASIKNGIYTTQPLNAYSTFGMCNKLSYINDEMFNGITKLKKGTTYTYSCKIRKVSGTGLLNYFSFFGFNKNDKKYIHSGLKSDGSIEINNEWKEIKYTKISNIDADVAIPAFQVTSSAVDCVIEVKDIQLEIGATSNYTPRESNKIKLSINEPLRSLPNGIKDKICVIDSKLMVERNVLKALFKGNESFSNATSNSENVVRFYSPLKNKIYNSRMVSDKIPESISPYLGYGTEGFVMGGNSGNTMFNVSFPIEMLGLNDKSDTSLNIQKCREWFTNNNTVVLYQSQEPIYEEVLNEYGEPIVLEGYENGTIYIDSTIVPTTTVRYTPKMESFKTLNEVANNNIMLTNDINDSIIPYMMNIDLMIMEKEMALPSQINMRTMEVLDMTSMQKRTQDMLERLVKGKTLTEQQCKDRVVVYLNANKITSEQADELMILISEIYA